MEDPRIYTIVGYDFTPWRENMFTDKWAENIKHDRWYDDFSKNKVQLFTGGYNSGQLPTT